jgi:hypothetical protein
LPEEQELPADSEATKAIADSVIEKLVSVGGVQTNSKDSSNLFDKNKSSTFFIRFQ